MQVRCFMDGSGENWFAGRDICALLGFKNASRTLGKLDDSEKWRVELETVGGLQETLMVSENGFATLIGLSKHPLLASLN